ncbi:MAG: hypothetical protein JOZ46_10275 [Candidatus Dormibacteraeota bacterium]|nr:hypothetical protein [Candidatus Dormibacteraeota bacterium]MBV9526184.1 hypothetical protein [Candidatus Dormibacteraeota bacterium]
MLAWVRRNPRPVALAVAAVVLIIAFFVVVAPLFSSSSVPTAEIAGALPASAVAGRQFEVDVGLDNTSYTSISPMCVTVQTHGNVRPDYAIFQDVDRRTFNGDSVCGGSLAGQASISVRLFFTATSAGSAGLTLTPAEGSHLVGAGLAGAIAVAAAG